MNLGRSNRSSLTLTQLEDRCNPATYMVTSAVWNSTIPGTLPHAVALANANPGQDIIDLNYNALGTFTPTFNVTSRVDVEDAVVIKAGAVGNGNTFATFTGTTPFKFTHSNVGSVPGASGTSEIRSGVFDKCTALGVDDGGAMQVIGGQVTTFNTRFSNNGAWHGGAVFVGSQGTLVVDAANAPNPDSNNPAFQEANAGPMTLFKGNAATGSGGAIKSDGTVIIKRGWFVENKTTLNDGGAIKVTGAGVVNTIAPGGGPLPGETAGVPMGNALVSFLRNTANRDGGAIAFDSTGASTLNDVVFGANTAKRNGGGISVDSGTVSVTGGGFSENTAAIAPLGGGGIYIGGAGVVNATNVTFQGNIGWHWLAVPGGTYNQVGCTYLP